MNGPPPWLRGLFAVLPTPMTAAGGLDLPSLDRVVDHYLDGGAAGLVPVSIAGEGHLLDEDERRQVIRRVARHARGRAPIVVGVLEDRLDAALSQASMAAAGGALALLVKPPRGEAQAVLEHIGVIARAQGLPIVLLDHPGFGGALPPDLVQALVDALPEVCGIKLEDEPTADKMARLRARLGGRLRIFGGRGAVDCLRELEHGADGFFTGSPFPAHVVDAMACFRCGDVAGAAAAQAAVRIQALGEVVHIDAMIGRRKALLHELGVIGTSVTRLADPLR